MSRIEGDIEGVRNNYEKAKNLKINYGMKSTLEFVLYEEKKFSLELEKLEKMYTNNTRLLNELKKIKIREYIRYAKKGIIQSPQSDE